MGDFVVFLALLSKADEFNKAAAGMREERSAIMDVREKLEKARAPTGAFWEVVSPAEDCRAYGTKATLIRDTNSGKSYLQPR